MVVIRGLAYFSIVFAVGFVLGVPRVLYMEPHFGARWAELMEAPVLYARGICDYAVAVSEKAHRLVTGAIASVLAPAHSMAATWDAGGIHQSGVIHKLNNG